MAANSPSEISAVFNFSSRVVENDLRLLDVGFKDRVIDSCADQRGCNTLKVGLIIVTGLEIGMEEKREKDM